jgi:hypothetical protein
MMGWEPIRLALIGVLAAAVVGCDTGVSDSAGDASAEGGRPPERIVRVGSAAPDFQRPFRDEMQLTFPILHDSDFRVGLTYGTRTLPMTFLVNRRGIVTHRIFGARDWQSPEAKKLIQSLIQGS